MLTTSDAEPPAKKLRTSVVRLPHLAPARPDGRVTGRTLIMMRWIAIVGQLGSLALIVWVFHIDLPVVPILATIGSSIALNLGVLAQRGARLRLTDQDATFYLAFDILQLSLLLYLTGGIHNPFTILLLAPLTVGAAILSLYNTVLMTFLTQACLAALALWHWPLPWRGDTVALPPLYLTGTWTGLAMASVMLASYVFRVAQESRRITDALVASQMALAREQRLSALGALAAAAAHELGTPLSTIAVVATELAHDLPPESVLAEDIALLQSQSQRCREILAELGRKPEADGGDPYQRLPLTTLVEAASLPHRSTQAASLTITPQGVDGVPEPVVNRRPEIMHGVGNLLQNALQFARSAVHVVVAWDAEIVRLTISDDGPGFSSNVLARLGEPYISARPDRSGHMGLGIFIAGTLLDRTGAQVEFSNHRYGGARVTIAWDRESLEQES